MQVNPKTGYLALQNGKVFRGQRFGSPGGDADEQHKTIFEVVFTTGVVGYLETLTDKSYYGQAVVQTFPQIGNYGVIPGDLDGDMVGPAAYIVKSWCQSPSNFRSEGDIDAFLSSRGVVGLWGVDTRALTKIIRSEGVMNGVIVDDPSDVDVDALRSYKIKGAVEAVSTKEMKRFGTEGGAKTVALIDFGYNKCILDSLLKRGCSVVLCPHDTTCEKIREMDVDGVVLSNGPGDPADDAGIIANVKSVTGMGLPVFGVGLGHQLAALAQGFGTKKLAHGHRGGQPVRDTNTGRLYIAGQNHGYAVDADSVDKSAAREIFVSAVDGANEGLEYTDKKMITVQFNPCGGAEDTRWVVDKFVGML